MHAWYCPSLFGHACAHMCLCRYRYVCISFLLSPSTPRVQYPLLTLHSLMIPPPPPLPTPTHSYHCWSLSCTLSILDKREGISKEEVHSIYHTHMHFPPTTLTHTVLQTLLTAWECGFLMGWSGTVNSSRLSSLGTQ